jgi:ABC-type transporter Mla subunit MlaD
MSRDRNALKAGIFIVLSFMAAVASIVLIRGLGTGAMQIRTVSFSLTDDLNGLSEGDDVRIGGAKVGSVKEIKPVNLDSTPQILVKFSIPAEYVLREKAEIRIQSALTGPPSLNISSFGSGNPLSAATVLTGQPDALIATIKKAAPDVEAVIGEFRKTTMPGIDKAIVKADKLIHDINEQVGPVAKEYTIVAQRASGMMADVRDLIGENDKSPTDLRGTMKNLNEATASVKAKLPPLMDKITGAVDKADGAVTSAKAALEDIEKASALARSVVTDNRSRIDTMIKSLKTTSDNLKATSVEVHHSPWRLFYHPGADEVANLNLFDSARQFAEGAANMSDACMALRDALKDPHVDKASKERMEKLVEHLDESFKALRDAEGKLWTSVKQ